MCEKIKVSVDNQKPICPKCMLECMAMSENRVVKVPYKTEGGEWLLLHVTADFYKCIKCGTEMQSDIQALELSLSLFKGIEERVGTSKMHEEDYLIMKKMEEDLAQMKEELNEKCNSERDNPKTKGTLEEELRRIPNSSNNGR